MSRWRGHPDLTVGATGYWKRPHHRGPGHDWLRVVEHDTGRRAVCGAELHALLDEVDRLRRWQAEATEALTGWDAVWDALGRPGPLGELRWRAVLHEIRRRLP